MRKFAASILLCLTATSAFAAGHEPLSTADYTGKYQLADGRLLTITDDNGRLWAQISRPSITRGKDHAAVSRMVQLDELAPARFVARTTPLEITFGPPSDGDIASVRVTEQAATVQALARR